MGDKMKKLLKRIPLLAFALLLLPCANATTYTQTLSGGRWTQHTIYVYVDPTPTWANLTSEGVMPNWAQLTVYQAIEIWNVAQDWFINSQKLNPNGKYALAITESPSQAKIHISFPHNITAKCGNLDEWTGCTTITMPSWTIRRAEIQLYIDTFAVLPFYTNDTHILRTIALHELGNSIGLWDMPSTSPLKSDVMYPSGDARRAYPSTLNLYAVYLIASNDLGPGTLTVDLRSNIQYMQWQPHSAILTPESPVPETTTPIVLLVFSAVSCAIVTRRTLSSRAPHRSRR